MRKKLRVLLVFDTPLTKPIGYDYKEEFKDIDWNTERDVYNALLDNGHTVRLLGINNDIKIFLEEIKNNKPDVIFNLVEVFDGKSHLDKNFVSLLEMINIPFTGSSAGGLLICNDKAMSKKILSYHKIKVPHFMTFYRKRKVWFSKRLRLPLVVKPLCEEASRGISLGSIVDDEKSMIDRVMFIHKNMQMDAIVEEYIEGRELYISVIGNKKIKALPPREVKFGNVPDDEPRIATYKAKWDEKYRKRWDIKNTFARNLANGMDKKMFDMCKRAYRALNMRCYARFDIRVTNNERMFIFEANANPCLAKNDEVAQSAEKAGISYNELIQKILRLAFKRDN
ncbi:MAG: ATP-grasp domain-containing protein [Candidatus Aureabacteria bacterium]|nr:ATP-grasp domain-containing protein [Candidatus Auribacterota bacterium]